PIFLQLIRGQRRGWWPMLLRAGLWLLSLGYGLAVRCRNVAYDHGWLRVHRAAVPVVSIGNLSVGGTGKTPFVEYVAGYFRQRERLVAILSRGYGASPETSSGGNDEARLLQENLPDVPHLQGADRVALAATAIEECESEVLVLDDGFQHRRLARDLDIVLLDATAPLDHLLPRGLLREPTASLRRADAIVLTRCDQSDQVPVLRKRLERLAPQKLVAECIHAAVCLLNTSSEQALDSLIPQPVAAFCGLGNPEAFRRTLIDLGASVRDFRIYPDHHTYSREDVDDLARWAATQPAETWLVTTQKDFVKLRIDQLGGRPLWALRVCVRFRNGQERLEALLNRVVESSGQGGPSS
ncbi:MAG: tetraacyldisaccharide 4'-kinase, partial [Gemmataceae bacterium]